MVLGDGERHDCTPFDEGRRTRPGDIPVTITASTPGAPRRFAIGEAYAYLVHLERTGYIENRPGSAAVDSWFAVNDTNPKLV
jgi:hypothetical protein